MTKGGTRIGRYELLGVLGSGGMGTVHLARRVGIAGFERTVALKQLHPHLLDAPEFLAMFMDEARLAGRIRHPNVVEVHDVESIDGQLVMAMSYVEGGSLDQICRRLVTRGEKLPLGIAIRVLHDALLGLHAAHELTGSVGEPLGLVHRDVSPHNVLLGVDGITRVTDFGVAKAAGRLMSTVGNTLKGKLCYLAPEQIRGEAIDRRVDVFAAGIILWECLTGERLFHGENEGEILHQVGHKTIDPPSRFRHEIPLAVDEACLTALARDRDRRYVDAATFARTLATASRAMARPDEVGALVALRMADVLDERRRTLETPHPVSLPLPPEPSADGVTTQPRAVLPETRRLALTPPRRARRWGAVLAALAVVALGSWALASSPRRRIPRVRAEIASQAARVLLRANPPDSAPPVAAAPSETAPVETAPVASARRAPSPQRPRPPAPPSTKPAPTAAPRPDPGEFVPETR